MAVNGLVVAAAGAPVFYSGQVVPLRAVDVISAARAGLTSGVDALASTGTYVGDSQVVADTDYPFNTTAPQNQNPRFNGLGAGTFYDFLADKIALADPTLEIDLADYIDPAWPMWNPPVGQTVFLFASVRVLGDPDPDLRQYENFELADYVANFIVAESDQEPGAIIEFHSNPAQDTARFPTLPSANVPHYQFVRAGPINWQFSPLPVLTVYAITMGAASTVEIRFDQLIVLPAYGVSLGGGYQLNSATGSGEPLIVDYDTRGDPRLSLLSWGLGTDFDSESQTSSQDEGQGFGTLERQKEDDDANPPEVTQQQVALTDASAPRSIAVRSGVYFREPGLVADDDFARTVTTGWSTRPLPSAYSLAWRAGVNNGTMSISTDGAEGRMDSSSTIAGRSAVSLFGTTWFVDVDNTAGESGPTGFATTRSLEGMKDLDIEVSVRATASPGSGQRIAYFGLTSFHNSMQPQLGMWAVLGWSGSEIDLYLQSEASIQALNNWPAGNNIVETVGPSATGVTTVTDTVRVRVRSNGLKVEAKAWEDGGTEPDWMLELWLPGGWNDGVNPSNWWLYPYADEPTAVVYTNPDFWRLTWVPGCRQQSSTGGAFGTRWDDFEVSVPGDGISPDDGLLEVRAGASVIIPEVAVPYGAEYLYAQGPVSASQLDRYEWSPTGSSLWQAIKSTVIHFVPEPGRRPQIWRYR